MKSSVADEKPPAKKAELPWLMYVSWSLSAWGDRMWNFGGSIFMAKLDDPNSLRFVAIYGLVTCVSAALLGASVGAWIDRKSRLTAARTFLAAQNTGVALSCAALAAHFWLGEEAPGPLSDSTAVAAVVVFLANLSYVASLGQKVVVEKDWIVVVAAGDQEVLATMNSTFRTIDLTCYVLSPAMAGALFNLLGSAGTAAFVAAWNLISMVIEYCLLLAVYRRCPELANKKKKQEEIKEEGDEGVLSKVRSALGDFVHGWSSYWRHPVRNAGFALACFYMTVLGFDSVTYAYCLHQGVPEALLGALVGLSAGVGITGSLSFPVLRRNINVVRAGAIGSVWLVLAHALCVVSVWVPGSDFELFTTAQEGESVHESQTSVALLIVGIVSARFGLWVADLSITQILQESVEETLRGTLGGVQGSLNALSDTLKFALVASFPAGGQFGYLVLASYASYCLGAASFFAFACSDGRGSKSRWKRGTAANQEELLDDGDGGSNRRSYGGIEG